MSSPWPCATIGELRSSIQPFADEMRIEPALTARYELDDGEGVLSVDHHWTGSMSAEMNRLLDRLADAHLVWTVAEESGASDLSDAVQALLFRRRDEIGGGDRWPRERDDG